MSATTKWIDLNDPVGVRLRVASLDKRLLYVITGIKPGTRLFTRVIEDLKFRSSPTGAYLIRPFREGEQVHPSEFRSIWPKAATRVMTRAEFFIDLDAARRPERTARMLPISSVSRRPLSWRSSSNPASSLAATPTAPGSSKTSPAARW